MRTHYSGSGRADGPITILIAPIVGNLNPRHWPAKNESGRGSHVFGELAPGNRDSINLKIPTRRLTQIDGEPFSADSPRRLGSKGLAVSFFAGEFFFNPDSIERLGLSVRFA